MKPAVATPAVLIVVAAAGAMLIFHGQQVHRDQLAAAQRRFAKIDSVHRSLQTLDDRFASDYKKMDADQNAAYAAGQKRHDDAESLTSQEMFDLAHTERTKVEAIEALQSDIDSSDQSLTDALSSLYGEDAVTKLRQYMSARNEAREDGNAMWWRAAESVEENAKAVVNGHAGSNSTDEIVRDYDESTKDDTHAEQLQIEVTREILRLEHRANLEWQEAKRSLALLQGGR
jgi:hypothetical protein